MAIRYYKLFDLLRKSGMKRNDLLAILSSRTIAKLGKGEMVNVDTIDKICSFLNCQPSDVMEYVPSVERFTDKFGRGFDFVIDGTQFYLFTEDGQRISKIDGTLNRKGESVIKKITLSN